MSANALTTRNFVSKLHFIGFFVCFATVTATNDTVTAISQQEGRSAPSSVWEPSRGFWDGRLAAYQ